MTRLSQLDTDRFFNVVTWIGFSLVILAAWFSIGFHHPDEHFQIIEFCNYKMGNIPAENLAWEYPEKLRPGLPVMICYGLFSALKSIGISNPFYLVFVLRLITGLTCWYVLKKFAGLFKEEFKTEAGKKIMLLMIFLLWCVPYLSVRFSSENQSGISLLAALFLLVGFFRSESSKSLLPLFFAGLLLGFSFFFRFQMGFAILGLGCWLLFIQKPTFKQWLILLGGGGTSFIISLMADYWLYHEWTFTPLNYFTANVINDAASGWGVSPWWYYFYSMSFQLIPPIGPILIVFFFAGILKLLKHPIVWVLIPFLFIHFLTPHKEPRFLFPIYSLFLLVSAHGIDAFIERGKFLRFGKVLFVLLFSINIPILLSRAILPAIETTNYYEFLYSYKPNQHHQLLCTESDPYIDYFLPVDFYKPKHISIHVVDDEKALLDFLASEKPAEILVLERKHQTTGTYFGYDEQTLYSFIPNWVTKININNWVERAHIWKIKLLKRKN